MTCQDALADILRGSLADEDLLESFGPSHQSEIRHIRFCAMTDANTFRVVDTLARHFAAAVEKDLYLKYVLTEAPTGVPS